ncbi:MAG: gamma-butyrobetaine hydroxylase-like domain-containing protein [Caulobacterales bacterium]|uniref:gamma-butyrobetaine hydroxylase-like domain-containing protein n=1 Tax=Glycocaulis sp. TaxID=1969725 RepID=UPI003FA1933E
MADAGSPSWPVRLAFQARARRLSIAFDDGAQLYIPFAVLRRESPSAEVQGHGTGEKRAVPHADHVQVTAAEPVGRYAVRLVFDDGHDSGIYSWRYLRQLGEACMPAPQG